MHRARGACVLLTCSSSCFIPNFLGRSTNISSVETAVRLSVPGVIPLASPNLFHSFLASMSLLMTFFFLSTLVFLVILTFCPSSLYLYSTVVLIPFASGP